MLHYLDKLFDMVETVLWRASSSEIRTTDVELETPTPLVDYFSCIYSIYSELPCIKPFVVIYVPKSSKPFALLSFGKKRDRILTPEIIHYTDPIYWHF